jgi:hypothetical protein
LISVLTSMTKQKGNDVVSASYTMIRTEEIVEILFAVIVLHTVMCQEFRICVYELGRAFDNQDSVT